jgi:uncharacterized membrane protein YphA (DoxX/SURF4 family)
LTEPTEPGEPNSEAAADEPEQPVEPEPVARPEPLDEPVATTEPEPAVEREPEPPLEPGPADAISDPERPVEPTETDAADAEPTAVVPEEPTAVAASESTAVVDEEPTGVVASEPTAVVGHEPTAVVDEEPTAVVASEPTAVVGHEPTAVVQEEPTVVVEQPSSVEDSSTQQLQLEDAAVPPVVPADAIFRPASPSSGPSPEPTRTEQLSPEEQKLAAERAARRDARAAALAAPAPVPLAAPTPVIVHKRTNDKFLGALGLFLLRIVLAGIFAIRGLNILTDIPTAQAQFARTIIPQPDIMAIVTGVAAELIALALLLGLLTRIAGLGVALIAGGALAFVYWGPTWSPFIAGQPGFLGEYELLLAVVGVLLLLIGGGGWSLDRSFRAGREHDKQEREAATD